MEALGLGHREQLPRELGSDRPRHGPWSGRLRLKMRCADERRSAVVAGSSSLGLLPDGVFDDLALLRRDNDDPPLVDYHQY